MKNNLDLVIIGAGPAGLSAAYAARQEGLRYLVIEKGTIADTIRLYPVGRTLFSTPNELEMYEGALKPCREKPTREELLSHYIHFVLDNDLNINADESVLDVQKLEPERFLVHTSKHDYEASRILFAIGAMAHPRYLKIPGEDLPKVHHLFVEPYAYMRWLGAAATARPKPPCFYQRKARAPRSRFGAKTGRTAIPKRAQ
jgi:thioredoxin reductase (NADPH)